MLGLKCPLQRTIKDTFALRDVPREALVVGLAGVMPYLATSLSTVYLAWDINHASMDGHGFLLSGETAEFLLNILEPLQVGYGAVVSHDILLQHGLPLIACPDHLLPGCHPLGIRMGKISRNKRLPKIRSRCRRTSRRLANSPSARRIRPHLPVYRILLPLLYRRQYGD